MSSIEIGVQKNESNKMISLNTTPYLTASNETEYDPHGNIEDCDLPSTPRFVGLHCHYW